MDSGTPTRTIRSNLSCLDGGIGFVEKKNRLPAPTVGGRCKPNEKVGEKCHPGMTCASFLVMVR